MCAFWISTDKRMRWLSALVAVGVIALALALAVESATATEFGFHIQRTDRGNTGSRLVPSPKPYVFDRSYEFLGLNGPQDLFYQKDGGYLWVADTGNHRIIQLTKDGEFVREIRQIVGGDDDLVNRLGGRRFNAPEGVFVNEDGEIFIADTMNKRIVQLHPDGTLKRIFPEPASVLLGEDFDYRPTKVVEDQRKYLYVVNRSDYRGLILLDRDGEFRGFFAPNKVGFSLRRVLIRLFATEAQREKLSKELPPPHSNIFLAPSGYIYTSTTYDQINQIKKLNGVGTDVMNREAIGDYRYGYIIERNNRAVWPNFVDLTVNEQGIISAIDAANGIIYQYDDDRNLLTMFGGKGEENGKFGYPISIETDPEGNLYILDKDRNNIQVFRPTHFAQLVHAASELYVDGHYALAEGPWREALKYNTNYNLAHSGIAKAFERIGRWEEALVEYRYGQNRDGYSEVFAKLRHEWIRDHFALTVLLFVLAFFVVSMIGRILTRILNKPDEESGPVARAIQMVWTVMMHPFDGFWQLKRENKGSVVTALVLVALTFGLRIADLLFTSYQIADIDPRDASFLLEVARLLLPWVLFCVASYGVTAIFEGEGFFRDIVIATGYSLGPYLMTKPITILLSHVLTRTEKSYLTAIDFAAWVWILILFFIHIQVTHNFTLRKSLGTVGLTLFGMVCIVAAVGLTYTLTDQIVTFVREIAIEITIRG
jgi:Gluconolactonase